MNNIGDLTISSANCEAFAHLQEVTGDLTIGIAYVDQEALRRANEISFGDDGDGDGGQECHHQPPPARLVLPRLTRISGALFINEHVQLLELKSVSDRLVVADGATLVAPRLIKVGKDVKLSGQVELPRLASVLGGIAFYINSEVSAQSERDDAQSASRNPMYILPALSSVKGWLVIHADVNLPALTLVGEYLGIGKYEKAEKSFAVFEKRAAIAELPLLTCVIGSVDIRDHAIMHAPLLTEIVGRLHIETEVCLPALTSVGSSISVRCKELVRLPVLATIGGNVEIRGHVELPMLSSVKGNIQTNWNNAILPSLASVGGNAAISYDANLPCLVSIFGNLSVSSPIHAPSLKYVGGELEYSWQGKLSAPLLASISGRPYPSDEPARHIGHLTIEANNLASFKTLAEVTGDLIIETDCEMLELVRVGGTLKVLQNVNLPMLDSIGGSLVVKHNCDAQLPELFTIEGGCFIAWKPEGFVTTVIPSFPKLQSIGGALNTFPGCEMPALKEVGKDLDISSNDLPSLDRVGGSLRISGGATLPLLRNVSDSIYIKHAVELPRLSRVGGSLFVSARTLLPMLMSVGEELGVSASSWFPRLRNVGKNLKISAFAHLPVLTSVTGNLEFGDNARLPALTKIGGDLWNNSSTTGHFPVLTYIGGSVTTLAPLDLPMLTLLGGKVTYEFENQLRAPRLGIDNYEN